MASWVSWCHPLPFFPFFTLSCRVSWQAFFQALLLLLLLHFRWLVFSLCSFIYCLWVLSFFSIVYLLCLSVLSFYLRICCLVFLLCLSLPLAFFQALCFLFHAQLAFGCCWLLSASHAQKLRSLVLYPNGCELAVNQLCCELAVNSLWLLFRAVNSL